MFDPAIDGKLRGCDVAATKVEDVAPNGCALARATVRRRKTGRPVRFEVDREQTRRAPDDHLEATSGAPSEFLFPTGGGPACKPEARGQSAPALPDWLRLFKQT